MNRKQRRAMNKVFGKQAMDKIDLMINLAEQCNICSAPFDKKSKEMAMTWFVDAYKDHVDLFCPKCQEERTNVNA